MKQNYENTSPFSVNVFTLNGISYGGADAMVNSFLQYKGPYDKNHPTCIWFSQAAFQQMNSIVQGLPGSDGVRFYFARTIPDGNYTIVVVSTIDGGLDPDDPTKTKHKHEDQFQHSNPAPTGTILTGRLGAVTPGQGALLYTPQSSPSPCPPGSDNCPDAPHYITCSKAYSMVNNVGSDEINATSEWFDKGIIDTLNSLIPENGGIRVYYARRLEPSAPDTIMRHGFVIIITKPILNPDGTWIQLDTFDCISLKNLNYPLVHYPFDGGGTDNGEQCPINCKGVTWP